MFFRLHNLANLKIDPINVQPTFLKDHPRNNSTLTSSIGHVSSTVSTSPHAMAFSSHLHYSPGLSVHGTSSQPHLSYPSNGMCPKSFH